MPSIALRFFGLRCCSDKFAAGAELSPWSLRALGAGAVALRPFKPPLGGGQGTETIGEPWSARSLRHRHLVPFVRSTEDWPPATKEAAAAWVPAVSGHLVA